MHTSFVDHVHHNSVMLIVLFVTDNKNKNKYKYIKNKKNYDILRTSDSIHINHTSTMCWCMILWISSGRASRFQCGT